MAAGRRRGAAARRGDHGRVADRAVHADPQAARQLVVLDRGRRRLRRAVHQPGPVPDRRAAAAVHRACACRAATVARPHDRVEPPPGGGCAVLPVAVTLTLGVVIGKFLPPHLGHSYLIETACAGADQVVVIVCARPDDPIPAVGAGGHAARAAPDSDRRGHPGRHPGRPGEATSRAWAERTTALLHRRFGRGPDLVFTSEEYGARYAAVHGRPACQRRPGPVAGSRSPAPRCAPTRGRTASSSPRACGPGSYGGSACVGAESTGTTTLARDLAEHYGCAWVPEYGRDYCERAAGRHDDRLAQRGLRPHRPAAAGRRGRRRPHGRAAAHLRHRRAGHRRSGTSATSAPARPRCGGWPPAARTRCTSSPATTSRSCRTAPGTANTSAAG